MSRATRGRNGENCIQIRFFVYFIFVRKKKAAPEGFPGRGMTIYGEAGAVRRPLCVAPPFRR